MEDYNQEEKDDGIKEKTGIRSIWDVAANALASRGET